MFVKRAVCFGLSGFPACILIFIAQQTWTDYIRAYSWFLTEFSKRIVASNKQITAIIFFEGTVPLLVHEQQGGNKIKQEN